MAYTDEDKAVAKIKGYLNVVNNSKWTKDYILTNYGIAVELLIEHANKLNLIKSPGVKSVSEGNQSITFQDIEAWTITDEIKQFLPAPYVRMW